MVAMTISKTIGLQPIVLMAGNPWILRQWPRRMTKSSGLLLAFSVVVAVLSGCASVKPWERDILAEPAMQLDPNPVVSSSDDHIYFSREASKGGRGFGGGGCGCN